MKLAMTILVVVPLLGCSQERVRPLPTAPSLPGPAPTPAPTPGSTTSLWGMVISESGICIDGATVQVVQGDRPGEKITQATPCDAWGYDGGFVITGVLSGVPVTLRASAAGYASQDLTVIPAGGLAQRVVLLTLSRIQ